jgi:hypothetical protein
MSDAFFFVIFGMLFIFALGMRYRWTFGVKSLPAFAQYVRSQTTGETIARFICSHPRYGNVGLFISKDAIECKNSDQLVFRHNTSEFVRFEYSGHNFLRFVTHTKEYKLSYLHHVDEGDSVSKSILFTPNLAYQDKEATEGLLAALDTVGIPHAQVPHRKVVFLPFQGSPAIFAFMLATLLVFVMFLRRD